MTSSIDKKSDAESRLFSGELWSKFCDDLKAAGDDVLSLVTEDPLDAVEGYRLLTRLLRGALEERLQALQIRRRVLRAAIAFERDSALFADDERNRRLVRSEAPAVSVATPRPSERGNATGIEVGAGNPAPPPADPGASRNPGPPWA